MKSTILALISVFAAANDVVTISAANWDREGKKGDIFILFVNDHCRECRREAGQLAKLADLVETRIGRVDCHFERQLCEKFNAFRPPHYLYLKDKKVYEYEGPLDAIKMAEFLSNYENHMVSDNLNSWFEKETPIAPGTEFTV